MGDVHETPTELETWVDLAAEAIGIEREQIEKVGMIDSGEEGKYAGRRVWFNPEVIMPGAPAPEGYLRSVLVVARDEIKTEELEAGDYLEAEGGMWAPYTVWGCEPCSGDCERHGADALTAVEVDADQADESDDEPEDPLADAPGQTIEDAILSLWNEHGQIRDRSDVIDEARDRWPEIEPGDWGTALDRLERDGFLESAEDSLTGEGGLVRVGGA